MNELSLLDSLFGNDGFAYPASRSTYSAPKVDVLQKKDCYVLLMDLPGMTENDVEITMKNDVLKIENAENKAAIVDIYTKANAATQDPGLSESVEMDLKRLAKNEASKIYDKPTNVLGAIVRSLTESIMKDKDIRQQYMTEDNHINMERIVNESTIIYTVLEELNSLQMVDVDAKYIKNMINSIS